MLQRSMFIDLESGLYDDVHSVSRDAGSVIRVAALSLSGYDIPATNSR